MNKLNWIAALSAACALALVILSQALPFGRAGVALAGRAALPAQSEPLPHVDVDAQAVAALVGSVDRGARLYDKWWGETGGNAPAVDQPLWALQTSNKRSGADTWRCKECHGWDYQGKDGAYASGSHATGFPGIFDAQSKSTEELVAALTGQVNPDHDFSAFLTEQDLADMAAFIHEGFVREQDYLDYASKAPLAADVENGKILFQGACAECHGPDGRSLNFHTMEEPEYVGTLANDNIQEFLHKARFGQPGSHPAMPSTYAWGWSVQDAVDLLGYAQTLPEK
ncbi:MAG: hypothetical protein D6790_21970 [Caldilineae bacterium]|nr:MAG: hypothetical protein D6790_21970 [Caldilineae bacterium]